MWGGHTHDATVGTEADLQQRQYTGLPQYLVNSQNAPFSQSFPANPAEAPPTHSKNELACDYVGQTEAAKNYGLMCMFLLRRTGNSSATTVVLNFER